MTRLISFFKLAVPLIFACMSLAGCSALFKMEAWKNFLAKTETLQHVSIFADRDVNSGYPLAVDIVTVNDTTVLNLLSGLRAGEWFAARADFQRQHQERLTVLSWELVPGQSLPNFKMPTEHRNAIGVVVFADYIGERSYRANVQNRKKIVLRLRRDDFEVVVQ